MTLLTWGIVYRAHHVAADATLIKIAWIFALGAVAFGGYFVAVLVAPIAAYLQTFRPIYVIDGYVRYREPDDRSRPDACGYAAALFADRSLAGEWEWLGDGSCPTQRSRRWSSTPPTPASTRSTGDRPGCCPRKNFRFLR